jgi:hypothetical protein
MKRCAKCGLVKDGSEFWKNQKYCKDCQRKRNRSTYWKSLAQKRKFYQRKYYSKHGEYRREQSREYLRKIKWEFIQKLGGKCMNCRVIALPNNVCIFDFHHFEKVKKPTNQRIKEENPSNKSFDITKVKLLCANCHRLEHYMAKEKN